jgi:DNA-binding Xre family transcriptional regulator
MADLFRRDILIKAMARQGYNRHTLASTIGITGSHMELILKGKISYPRLNTVVLLAAALGLEVDELINYAALAPILAKVSEIRETANCLLDIKTNIKALRAEVGQRAVTATREAESARLAAQRAEVRALYRAAL